MNLTETNAASIANEQLVDRMPQSIKKVYVYKVVNDNINIPLYIPNGRSIVRVTNDGDDIFADMKGETGEDRYIEVVASSTLQEYMTNAPATQTVDQALRNLKDITIYTNHKFKGSETDRFFITIGTPYTFTKYAAGQQIIYELANTENLDIADIDDESTDIEDLALESGYVRELKLSSILMKENSLGDFTRMYPIKHTGKIWDGVTNELALKVNSEIMIGNVYGVSHSNIGGSYENLPINFEAKNKQLTPIKVQPSEINHKIEYFHDWADLDMIMTIDDAEKMISKDGVNLNTLFSEQVDIDIIKDIILFTYSSITQYKAIARNDQGKFDPKYKIGISQTPLNALLDSNDIQLAINKLFETYLYDNPSKRTSGGYRKVKAVAIALSRYVRWQEAVAKGNNPLNQVYLPWFLEMTTKIEVKASGTDSSHLEMTNEPLFKLKSEWFDIIEEDDNTDPSNVIKKGIYNKDSVDLTNSKLIQLPERKMELGKLDAQFSSGSLKSSMSGGDINPNSIKDFNYVLYGIDEAKNIGNYLSHNREETKYKLNTEYDMLSQELPVGYIPTYAGRFPFNNTYETNSKADNNWWPAVENLIHTETEYNLRKTMRNPVNGLTYELTTTKQLINTKFSNSLSYVSNTEIVEANNGELHYYNFETDVEKKLTYTPDDVIAITGDYTVIDNNTKIYYRRGSNPEQLSVGYYSPTTNTLVPLNINTTYRVLAIINDEMYYVKNQAIYKTALTNGAVAVKVLDIGFDGQYSQFNPTDLTKLFIWEKVSTDVYNIHAVNLTSKTITQVATNIPCQPYLNDKFPLYCFTNGNIALEKLPNGSSEFRELKADNSNEVFSSHHLAGRLINGVIYYKQKFEKEGSGNIQQAENKPTANEHHLTGNVNSGGEIHYYLSNSNGLIQRFKYKTSDIRNEDYNYEFGVVPASNIRAHTFLYAHGPSREYSTLSYLKLLLASQLDIPVWKWDEHVEIVYPDLTDKNNWERIPISIKDIEIKAGDSDETILSKAISEKSGRLFWPDVSIHKTDNSAPQDIIMKDGAHNIAPAQAAGMVRSKESVKYIEDYVCSIITKSDTHATIQYYKWKIKNVKFKFVKPIPGRNNGDPSLGLVVTSFSPGNPKFDKTKWLKKIKTVNSQLYSTLIINQSDGDYSESKISDMLKFTIVANKGSFIKLDDQRHGPISQFEFELNSNKDETVNQTEFLFV